MIRLADSIEGKPTKRVRLGNLKRESPGLYMMLDLLARSRFDMGVAELVRRRPHDVAELLHDLYPGVPLRILKSIIASYVKR